MYHMIIINYISCLLHRLFQGSEARELETSEKREKGMMGTSAERELQKEERERLGTRQFKK